MNIKEAKEQIKNAMTAYFTKDEFGNYVIPVEKQRPIFLLGAPGIGKTAIMEQIACELDVALVSYSMTHHTRQSALGLPYIEKKVYGGKEYSVSEYTMSEIISSVYDMIETTGKKEGILFLDEINCVSETLSPSMLQFLQYKIFGKHRVPDGWIVVTAGNPPEYNNSVREFDIATWDRLKKIEVDPDYDAWREYAMSNGIHASVVTYLDVKKTDFYKIETTVDGKTFVTARGWADLSDMIKLYELNGITVDVRLISQYLQNRKIANDFAIYYDLFNKYKSDYRIEDILDGRNGEDILLKASEAPFDERLALVGLLIDGLNDSLRDFCIFESAVAECAAAYKSSRPRLLSGNESAEAVIGECISSLEDDLSRKRMASSVSRDRILSAMKTVSFLRYALTDRGADIKSVLDEKITELKAGIEKNKKCLSNVFSFCDRSFGDGQELLILVTELTAGKHSSHFISRYGCPEYYSHNRELMFCKRQKDLISELEDFDHL